MQAVNRRAAGLALAIAVSALAACQGESTIPDAGSLAPVIVTADPAPARVPKATARVPGRAFCTAAGAYFARRDETSAALRRAVEDCGLFADAPLAGAPRKAGDAQVNLERQKTVEQGAEILIAYEMRCYAHKTELVARYTTSVRVRLPATRPSGPEAALLDAERLAEDRAIRVLLARLVFDEAAIRGLSAPDVDAQTADATDGKPPAPPPPPPPSVPVQPQTAEGATFVLVVGVDEYADPAIPRLRFAEADAREVFAFFATDKRSPADMDRVKILVGKDATREGVLLAIREHLAMKATRGEDTAILYIACHGLVDVDQSYLAFADTKMRSLPESGVAAPKLAEAWDAVPAGHKMLILDACHASAVGRTRGLLSSTAIAPSARAAAATGSIVLASTGENELAVEDEQLGHGIFTVALLNGLRGEADSRGTGRVTAEELGAFVKRRVPQLVAKFRGKQEPRVDIGKGGASFPVTR